MKLTQIERTYLLRASDRVLNLSLEKPKMAEAARPTINKLVNKGLLRKFEEEGEDWELYEITDEGLKSVGMKP